MSSYWHDGADSCLERVKKKVLNDIILEVYIRSGQKESENT